MTKKIAVRGAYLRSSLLSRLGDRKPLEPHKFRPFVYRNRQRLEDAHETSACAFCGYTGPALAFIAPEGEMGPARLVYAGESAFTRALERCTPTCCNCLQEQRSSTPAKSKSTLITRPVRTLEVLGQLQEQGEAVAQPVSRLPLPSVSTSALQSKDDNLFSEVHAAVLSLASRPEVDEAQRSSVPDAQ
jgi:hypothetical protein